MSERPLSDSFLLAQNDPRMRDPGAGSKLPLLLATLFAHVVMTACSGISQTSFGTGGNGGGSNRGGGKRGGGGASGRQNGFQFPFSPPGAKIQGVFSLSPPQNL